MLSNFVQQAGQVHWQANKVFVYRRPCPRCAAARDVPDTSRRHSSSRPSPRVRQRIRAPVQPQAPPPMDQNPRDHLFLDPGQLDFQQQLNIMQEAFAQMNDSERQLFMEYLADQEALAAREVQSTSPSSHSPSSSPERPPDPQQRRSLQASSRFAASAALDVATETRVKLQTEAWRLLLDSLPKRDAALLTKALPNGWNGTRDLSRRDVMEGLSRLTRAEQRRLPRVLEQVEKMKATIGAVADVMDQEQRLQVTRQRRLAAQKGLTLPSDDEVDDDEQQDKENQDEEDEEGAEAEASVPTPTNLSDLLNVVQRRLRQQLRKLDAQQEELPTLRDEDHPLHRIRLGPSELYDDTYDSDPYDVADRQQQAEASTSGGSNSETSNGRRSSGGVIPDALQERLGRMAAAYDQYVAKRGWETDRLHHESTEMRNMFRLHTELQELVAVAAAGPARGPGGAPATSRMTALFNQELEQQMEDLAGQVAALMQPEQRRRLQDPAAQSVLRYIETQLVTVDSNEGDAMDLDLDEQSVARLGKFMRAAVNWEAYRAFMDMYAARHPELELKPVMIAAGMSDGDEWWVKPPDIGLDGGDDDEEDEDCGVPSLRSRVDWPRVEAVAALDVDSLAFLTELEATKYSEDTFMKWYFHPVIGPRIRSGKLLDSSAAIGSEGAAWGAAIDGRFPDDSGSSPNGPLDPAALLGQLLGGMGVGGRGEEAGGGTGEGVPPMVLEAMEEVVRGMRREEGEPVPRGGGGWRDGRGEGGGLGRRSRS